MMDIYSKAPYPSCALSNFAEHPFVMDGVTCASMEGFLQSLKFRSMKKQRQVCRLSGKAAKNAPGRLRNWRWKLFQKLYWNGKVYKRSSMEYDCLITSAFDALFANPDFQKALEASVNEPLCHSIGCHDETKTVLTEQEFIWQLYRLRERCGSD